MHIVKDLVKMAMALSEYEAVPEVNGLVSIRDWYFHKKIGLFVQRSFSGSKYFCLGNRCLKLELNSFEINISGIELLVGSEELRTEFNQDLKAAIDWALQADYQDVCCLLFSR